MISPDLDFSDRLDVIVDSAAEPVDLDDAVADFLIQFTRSIPDASRGTDRNFPEANER